MAACLWSTCRTRHALLLVASACAGSAVAAEDPQWSKADVAFFEERIRPVLVERCYRCHSRAAFEKNQLKGGLLLDTRDGLLKGGDSGLAVEPGDAAASLLLESLRYESFEMPPDGQLPENVIADFATWIDRGAADPRSDTATIPSRAIDMQSGREHWAYRPLAVPPKRPSTTVAGIAAPGSSRSAEREPTTPIDAFLEARLQQAGISPLPEADRATLARRLSFDLVGLPPTPEQLDAFVADTSPDAYERLVERLLASPHFGQRWGRHWLDVARFAESVTLRGLVQHEAWRYRDYVIESFNGDLPFDDFVRQQIAGDLLPAGTLEQRRRNRIATTFLALADANLEDQDKDKLRMDVVDEQLSVIGSALLGQTIGCARCHDHKFDPIPTTDYYAMAGILRNTKSMEHANVSRWLERPLPLPPELERQVAARERDIESLEQQLAALKKNAPRTRQAVAPDSLPGVVLDDEQATLVGQWQRSTYTKPFVGIGYQHDGNSARGEKSATFRTSLSESGMYEVRLAYTPGENRSSSVQVSVVAAAGEQSVIVNQQQQPPIEDSFVALGRYAFTAAAPAEVVITNRGATGHVVIDAVQFLPVAAIETAAAADPDPSVAPPAEQQAAADPKRRQQQIKRLEAELKQVQQQGPQRPLYMAVEEEADITDMRVNIRGNVHQLGTEVPRGFLQVVSAGGEAKLPEQESGRRELGEWLASPSNPLPARVFVNRAWHWLFGAGIVPSPDNLGTTGQPPSHPELLDYLAGRFVEQNWSVKAIVREIVLSQAYRRESTRLPSQAAVDPENRLLWRMNSKRLEAECLMDAVLSVSGQLDERMGGTTIPDDLAADYGFEHDNPRRAVYWPAFRNALPEMLRAFDGANPSLVTGRRNVSSVAPQALFLMNDPWILDHSRLTAERLLDAAATSEAERLQRAFLLTLGRPPADVEQQAAMAFLNSQPTAAENSRLAQWTGLVQSLFCTLDFRFLH